LDISPLSFHIVPKLVQALVIITYDDIFLALAVEEDILLLKTFPDLSFNGVIKWKSLASEMFLRWPNM
jgi:hypothetical protein